MRIGAFYRLFRVVFGTLTLLGGLFFISQWLGITAYHSPNIWAFFWVAIGVLLISSALSEFQIYNGSLKRKGFMGAGNFVALEAMVSIINLLGGISLVWISTFLDWGFTSRTSLQEALNLMPLAITFIGVNLIASTKTFFVGMALFLFSLSIFGFITIWGILANRRWTTQNALLLWAVNLPLGFFFLSSDCGSFTSIFINSAAIYYLIRPRMKTYLLLLTVTILFFLISFSVFINWSFYNT